MSDLRWRRCPFLTRISHQVPAATGDASHPTTFSRLGALDVPQVRAPRPSVRKPRWGRHLAGLAAKPGEICGLGLALVLTVSCGVDQNTLAIVGGRRVDIVPFQTYVGEVTGEAWQAVSARVTSRLIDQYVDRQLVLEAARRRDVNLSAISTEVGSSEVQWLLDELCGPAPEPSENEISTEVGRKAEEARPARAHVRQLLLDGHEQGLEALQRLSSGEDFVEVSRQLSRAPNASDGGELGFFDQGSLPPEIDEVIFSLAPGEFSEPVQGPSGYHVFQVLEVVPEGPPDLAEVEAGVRSVFAQKMVREHIQGCIRGLASEIGIEIYDKHLWFPYTGRYAEEH